MRGRNSTGMPGNQRQKGSKRIMRRINYVAAILVLPTLLYAVPVILNPFNYFGGGDGEQLFAIAYMLTAYDGNPADWDDDNCLRYYHQPGKSECAYGKLGGCYSGMDRPATRYGGKSVAGYHNTGHFRRINDLAGHCCWRLFADAYGFPADTSGHRCADTVHQ